MSRRFKADAFDLLGQKEIYPYPAHIPGRVVPRLSIAWNSFHQNFLSELKAFFTWTPVPKGVSPGNYFRDCRIPNRIPARAVVAAALWHMLLFFTTSWPELHLSPKRASQFEDTELTWSGPIEDLPLLNVPKAKARGTKAKPAEPTPEGRDAYHPRQRIFTDPVQPNHPRQTLVQPADPMEAPKIMTQLPNMVLLAQTSGPARPRLEISEKTLAKLRPKEVKRAATTDAAVPDLPNMETRPAELSVAMTPNAPARPKLELNGGSAPRMAERTQAGEAVAPELNSGNGASGGPAETIIALSASPAPPTPVVEVPKGNTAARVSISPEGTGAGTGGGSRGAEGSGGGGGGNGEGKGAVGITISGGAPKPNAGVSGLGGGSMKLSLPRAQAAYQRPDPSSEVEDPPRTGPPNFAVLPPGAPPEQIFSSRRVYSMNVNMPNLNSVTGSWVIHFSETPVGGPRSSAELTSPEALRKVDPKYPQTAIDEHIEGEVILFGVIRPDGSVDSIQVVRSLDPELDANAASAFKQWKFQPATKNGQPVALDAIVHIPFRGPERQ